MARSPATAWLIFIGLLHIPGSSSIANGVCPSSSIVTTANESGPGSLRDAIDQANACDGSNTITIAENVTNVLLSTAGDRSEGDSALAITRTVLIVGNGVTIQRADDAPELRLLLVGTNGIVTLSNLTLAGGRAVTNASGLFQVGGCILTHGMLTVSNCTIRGNASVFSDGGAICNSGELSIFDSTVSSNFSGSAGGGIKNFGTLTISHSAINSNTVAGNAVEGGGIHNGGMMTVDDTIISDNYSGVYGGGIFNASVASITGCTVERNNTTLGDGGGIVNEVTMAIHQSTIRSNRSGSFGIAGAGVFNDGDLTITETTISGNIASNGVWGGGILNRLFGAMAITNCTISGNVIGGDGGGIFNFGVATIANSTITGNSATGGNGGGIANAILNPPYISSIMTIDTIIAGNLSSNQPDVSGNFDSQGHNLIGNTNGSTGFLVSDLANIDPLLGPLRNNGGPTSTHALLTGSPALDAGDTSSAPFTDQRGFPRIFGDIIDIGAFEFQNASSQIDALVTLVESFDLPPAVSKHLVRRLQNIEEKIGLNSASKPCHKLDRWIRKVGHWKTKGKIVTTEQSDQLINSAQQAQETLACP